MGASTLSGMTNQQQESRGRLDWINTISLAHVYRGIAGGFMQADHGSGARLAGLQAGDRVVFYSPRTDHPDGDALQQFTACGTVIDHEPYQVELSADFHPWRRNVVFAPCVPVPVRALLDDLAFVTNRAYWGVPFRRGLFTISPSDYDRIAAAMGASSLVASARAA